MCVFPAKVCDEFRVVAQRNAKITCPTVVGPECVNVGVNMPSILVHVTLNNAPETANRPKPPQSVRTTEGACMLSFCREVDFHLARLKWDETFVCLPVEAGFFGKRYRTTYSL